MDEQLELVLKDAGGIGDRIVSVSLS
jgi:hypothetical protein